MNTTIQHEKKKKEGKLENVVVRIRKLDRNEKLTLHTDPNDKTVLYFDKNYEIEKYNFDIVFDENDTNETVFNKIGGPIIINNVCNGFKETILTYGQTGSGKTYTLFGSKEECGITYFFLNCLCNIYKRKIKKINIFLSIYEIVGDTLVDLIKISDDQHLDFHVEEYYLKTIKYPYKVINVTSYEMAKRIIDAACLMRNVDATSQNVTSSRSHAIIQFFVNTTEKIKQKDKETTRECFGVLTLVDLVGCEREDFHISRQGSRTDNKPDGKGDKTSSKTLNSSLTSLNKMLRKMQMGMLDESDKRQSVLCKVLYNYIQKTCGVCLIFCFNPKLSQKSLTSSTLIMAYECKKIKSKRKQLIYVKSENKESFFNNITEPNNTKNETEGKSVSRQTQNEHKGDPTDTNDKNRKSIPNETFEGRKDSDETQSRVDSCSKNAPIFFIFVNEKGIVQNVLKKGDEDENTNSLRSIVNTILKEQRDEETKNKNLMDQLENEIVQLKKECRFWKQETQNYHNKLKILNKNYMKINEFLTNTLNGNPEIKAETKLTMESSLGMYENSSSINSSTGTFKNEDMPLKHGPEMRAKEKKKGSVTQEQTCWNPEHDRPSYSPSTPAILKNEKVPQTREALPYDQNVYVHRKGHSKNYKISRRELPEEFDNKPTADYSSKEFSFDGPAETSERYSAKANNRVLRKETYTLHEEPTEHRLKQNSHYWSNVKREEAGSTAGKGGEQTEDLINMHKAYYQQPPKHKAENTLSVASNISPHPTASNFPNQKMPSNYVTRENTMLSGNSTSGSRSRNDDGAATSINGLSGNSVAYAEGVMDPTLQKKDPLKTATSNTEYGNLKKDVTIDALVSRMKSRMAKTRSLSLAQ